MKTSKIFTIDTDLAERLKQINASQLVNTLLKEYFEVRSDKNTLLDEKIAGLDQVSKKKRLWLKIFVLLRILKLSILTIFQRIGLNLVARNLRKMKSKLILQGERAPFLRRMFRRGGN